MLLLNKVEDKKSEQLASEIQEKYSRGMVPDTIKEFEPFAMPAFKDVLTISAQKKLGLAKFTEVTRELLDTQALENEVESGGELMTPEQKKERLAFELTHGLI